MSWSDFPCIEARARFANGYGKIGKANRLAHRVAYEQHHGAIPDGMQIDHLCFNRACIQIEHLEAVTPAENNRRRVERMVREREVCRNGLHPWTPENIAVSHDGRRRCRPCNAIKSARNKRKAQLRAAGIEREVAS